MLIMILPICGHNYMWSAIIIIGKVTFYNMILSRLVHWFGIEPGPCVVWQHFITEFAMLCHICGNFCSFLKALVAFLFLTLWLRVLLVQSCYCSVSEDLVNVDVVSAGSRRCTQNHGGGVSEPRWCSCGNHESCISEPLMM